MSKFWWAGITLFGPNFSYRQPNNVVKFGPSYVAYGKQQDIGCPSELPMGRPYKLCQVVCIASICAKLFVLQSICAKLFILKSNSICAHWNKDCAKLFVLQKCKNLTQFVHIGPEK
uniref:Uncharacterized protein n=1 Tax=Rhizophagus irregularis (strain DAOM 181602 / DAOM 197198 / MUCL 43194) TaxID=747089 RepID=U9SQ35_RHIID